MKKKYYFSVYIATVLTLFFLDLQAQKSPIHSSEKGQVNFSCSESIKIHTDRDLYIAGENLFFKIYLTNSDNSNNLQISNFAYLILRDAKANINQTIIKLENGRFYGSLYLPDTLKSGMYQLIAYTNYMRNFDENVFFRKDLLIINRFDKFLTDFYKKDTANQSAISINIKLPIMKIEDSGLKIELEKDSFQVREKIKIKLDIDDLIFKNKTANLSVSVKEIIPFLNHTSSHGSFSFESSISEDSAKQLSDYLSTSSIKKFLPEKKGIYVKGKIQSDKMLSKDNYVFVSTPDTAANFEYSYADQDGNFVILMNNFYIGKELILKLKNHDAENPDSKILLEDKFKIKNNFVPILPELTFELKKYIFKCQDIVQIQKTFDAINIKATPTNSNENNSFPYIYRYPTSQLIPGEFIPLENFEEIASNLIIGLKLKKNVNKYESYLVDRNSRAFFTQQPFIFLDGVPIDDVNQIAKFSSADIKKIDLCNILKIKGELTMPGIVSIISHKNLINSIQLQPPFLKYKLERFLTQTIYQLPDYEKSSNQDLNPDFRQLLYWNPDVQIKPNESNTIEFFASDYLTEYLIEFVGFLPNGKPISAYKKLKIYR